MTEKALAPSVKVTSQDPKGCKFMSIVSQSYDKAGLTPEQAQRLNETSGLGDVVDDWIEANRYFGLDDRSCFYGYRPINIEIQVKRLCRIFDCHGSANHELLEAIKTGHVKLPEGAESWFAVPNWRKLGRIFGNTYLDAVQTMLMALRANLVDKFTCHLDLTGNQYPFSLRQKVKSDDVWKNIRNRQNDSDILIIPGQLGLRHFGLTDTQAFEKMVNGEFPLGVFANGCMLLTHPDRMINNTRPFMYCSGDEVCGGGKCWKTNVLLYEFCCNQIKLKSCSSDTGYHGMSTSTGFVLEG